MGLEQCQRLFSEASAFAFVLIPMQWSYSVLDAWTAKTVVAWESFWDERTGEWFWKCVSKDHSFSPESISALFRFEFSSTTMNGSFSFTMLWWCNGHGEAYTKWLEWKNWVLAHNRHEHMNACKSALFSWSNGREVQFLHVRANCFHQNDFFRLYRWASNSWRNDV